VVTVIIVTAGPAGAHAYVVVSEPADGALLDATPHRVHFRFSEHINLKYASVTVHDLTGRPVRVGPLHHDGPVLTTLTGELGTIAPGSYTVLWRVVGTDEHVVYGATSFALVGAGAGVPAALGRAASVPATSPAGVAGLLTASRALVFLALAALVGGGVFLTLVWPAGAATRHGRLLLSAGVVLAGAGTIVGAGLEQTAITGQHLPAAALPSTLVDATSTHFGWVAIVRLGLLVLAGVLLVDVASGVARSRWWRAGAVAVSLGLVHTTVQVGHAAEATGLRSIAYLVHVAAVTAWIGGVLALVFVVLPQRATVGELRAVVLRFSRVASVALALVVGTGIVLATPVIELWRHVPGSDYGRIFVVKLAVLSVGLLVANRARQWAHHDRAATSPPNDRRPARTLQTEAVLLATVIGVTAMLAGRPPIRPSRFSTSPGESVASSTR